MKININNWILTCKKQHLVCDGCCFGNSYTCARQLNDLCLKYNCIFLKTDSSDLFKL